MPESIIELLYQYIEERRIIQVLPRSGEAARRADAEAEQLEGLLEGEAARLFQQYLGHETRARLERDLALVRCSLSIGLELGRL